MMEGKEDKQLEEIIFPPKQAKRKAQSDTLDNLFIQDHNENIRHLLSTLITACLNSTRTVLSLARQRKEVLADAVEGIGALRQGLWNTEKMLALGRLPRPENSHSHNKRKKKEPVSATEIVEFISSFRRSLDTAERDIPSVKDRVDESRKVQAEVLAMIKEVRKIKRSLKANDETYQYDVMHPRAKNNEATFIVFEEVSERYLNLQKRILDLSESVFSVHESEPIQRVLALEQTIEAKLREYDVFAAECELYDEEHPSSESGPLYDEDSGLDEDDSD